MSLQAIPPTFGGNASHITIGATRYGLPPDTAVRRIYGRKHADLVYVLEHDDTLHALTERGEVPISPRLVDALMRRYFPQRANKIR